MNEAPGAGTLQTLFSLGKKARASKNMREAGFLIANETRHLVDYRQSALWVNGEGMFTLSGVVQIEANVPYVQWVSEVIKHGQSSGFAFVDPSTKTTVSSDQDIRGFSALDLPDPLSVHWDSWWPSNALWLPFESGVFVLVRDRPWSDSEMAVLSDWIEIWGHEFARCQRSQSSISRSWFKNFRAKFSHQTGKVWWRRPIVVGLLLCVLVLFFPVRLTVLASGELTPANPVVVRSPLDGVIDVFHVSPNQQVKKDQPLFGFDEVLTKSRLVVASQALVTAEAEYRQTVYQAMVDVRAKNQLSSLTGKIQEKRAEVDFLSGQLKRTRVLSPLDGVVLMDEPSEWIGRPVSVGERILRVASSGDVEVEAWLAISDAIVLPVGAEVSLYLNASPLNAVKAIVRYVAHDAVQRPDGQFAYRVRAKILDKTDHRVGLKGTAKLHGGWVPLAYWVFRRPLASARVYLGV
jgi:hypothetical protein